MAARERKKSMRLFEVEFGHKRGTMTLEVRAETARDAIDKGLDLLCETVAKPLEWQVNGVNKP
jgi:hypothetical protein